MFKLGYSVAKLNTHSDRNLPAILVPLLPSRTRKRRAVRFTRLVRRSWKGKDRSCRYTHPSTSPHPETPIVQGQLTFLEEGFLE